MRAIIEYWQSIHTADGLPGRQHFDPVQIPRLVANIRLLDVIGDPPRFRIRLTGTRLTEFFGSGDTGQWMDDIHRNFGNTLTYQSYMRVVETRLPNWRRDRCDLRGSIDCVQYERIQLPFATNGMQVDMILVYGIFGRVGEPLF